MPTFFTIIFFLSFPALLLGLIRPLIYSRILKGNATRKKLSIIFGGTILVSFIGIAVTVPPTEDVPGIAEENEAEVQPAVEEAISEEGAEESNLVEGAEDANLAQEDEVESEASFVTEEPQTVVEEDSGGASEDVQANTASTQSETASPVAEVSDEPDPVPAEVETAEPIQEAEETEVAEETVTSPQEDTTTASCYCSSNIYNCSTEYFSSHAEAQALYECCLADVGYDVHDLDRNSDGQACESLP